MADTSQQELSEPHTNGAVDGLTEEEKSKMRPADIDADMREMERRKRVEMMMNSRLFREELERIIETQMKDGGAGPSGLLQQISDMMGAQGARFNSNVFKSSNCVVPINDIRGVESMGYAKGEKLLRCKLAAVFRLLDLYGWTQGVGGHITARLNQDQEHFLVNPYGLLYHEVTASSLVKVDMQGSVVEQGTTNFGVHITGFQLHSTIHAARPDIKCIVHITTPSVIAVSSLKCGLLPLGQESIVIGEVSTHQYIGGVFEPEEKEKISRNLGPVNKIMFLTNRGALCCGETVEEAFYNVYNTVLACETQLKLIPVGIDNLTLVSEESRKAIFEASRKPPVPQHASVAEPSPLADKLEKRWRIGGTEFEALMRMLDNAGFRTGYIYRHPLIKGDPPRPRNDVEVPPAVSSLGYLLEEEELYKQGLWKGGRKGTDRSRWLNSPNVYQKVEILETGTPDPKKITKWVDQNAEEWVTDGSPTHSSTPVKIESALQFVPKNTNPKEFKQLQQQIKDYRRADKISAGPQSHILEGVTWDEAKKMQDATITTTGEQVVLVGAASKGIIQRGFQHNAMVYKTPYAKNPFDAVTDQELDQYKKDVERKQKGDPYDESQSESEALSSFNVSRATHESSTAKSPVQSPISVTSETEEESRDEPRVLRIETKQVPAPSQPEVVLSDEPTAAAVVVDSPLVQQAQLQQVEQQSLSIAQQKPSVDATTEFLNEMRRSAVSEPRNDLNRRDCQSSNCSSISSGHSYGWPTEPYDTIQLEVARSTTVAPRMTPLITDIVHSSKTKTTAELERTTNIRIKEPPLVPPKPKSYLALRRAFFDNNSPPNATPTLITYKIVTPNNENEIVSLNYTLEKTQSAENCELLNVSTEQSVPIDFSIRIKSREAREQSMSNKDSESNSGGNVKEVVNISCSEAAMETGSNTSVDISVRNLSLERKDRTNSVECVHIATDILKNSTSVAGDSNDCETVFRQTRDESHKPLIVGAILKNINDLHTLCRGTDVEYPEQPDSKHKESSTEHSKNQDLVSQSDENGNLCTVSDDHFDNDDGIVEHDTCVDYNSNLFELNTDVVVDQQNIACESVSPTSDTTNQELLDSQDDSDSFIEENALHQNPENSFTEPEDLSGFRDRTTKLSPLIIRKSNVSTPPRSSNYCRMDSLTELVNSVKTDLTPTKMLLAMLPESNISSKYNLDSTSMSLIYSLTPTNDSDTDADIIENKHKRVDLLDGSYDDSKFQRHDSCNTDDGACDNESDYFWVDLLNEAKKDDKSCDLNQTIELSDSSMESSDECDSVSNQGSDILELPYSTVCELRETDGESFNQDMKATANQIIADLGDIEIYTQASNVIDEILYDISCLKLDSNINKKIVASVVQDKLQALSIAKNMANTLIANLPCYGDRERIVFCEKKDSKYSRNRTYSLEVEPDDSVIIIDEIVHHVIDVFESTNSISNFSLDSYDLKKVKESTNTELKEMQNNIKYQTGECNNNPFSQTDDELVFFKGSTPTSTTCEQNGCNVVEQLYSVNEVETVYPRDLETEKGQSSQGACSSSDESFTVRENKDVIDVSDRHKSNEDERLFITLESLTSSNYSTNLTSDGNESVTDTDNNMSEFIKIEGTNNEELYCGCESCPSPLDCDDCLLIRFKQYQPVDEQNHSQHRDTSADGVSLPENTDSDITDNDTLGEAILEFCSVPKRSHATEEVELNFSIERHESREDNVLFSNTFYRTQDNALDFVLPEQLAPIFEEIHNEAFENSFNREVTIKTEKQVDSVDFFLDTEMAIAELFNEYANTSRVDKTQITSPNPSVLSFDSANTLDYYSCKDDSHSTMFQSLQNTTESSPNIEKNSNMNSEIKCETVKIDENLDRTYTLSDSSTNSLDTISSIESDDQKCSGKFADLTYSADISTNMDETRLCMSTNRNSSSSSSEALLLNDDHYFDTTTNMADVSSDTLGIKLPDTGLVDEDKSGANKGEDQNCVEPLPQDCMVYSYDTREFMLLEKALDVNNETKLEMQVCCTCVSKECEKFCTAIDADVDVSTSLDLPPKYEDTTLYKIVSQINLTDILNSVPDSPKH